MNSENEDAANKSVNKDLMLKLLKDASERVVSDVARELYSDKRMNTGEGTLSIREYCEHNNIEIITSNGTNSSLVDCNLLTVEFDGEFAFAIIDNLCVNVYEKLKKNCKEGLAFLRLLLSESNVDNILKHSTVAAQVEEFQSKVKAVYKGVSHEVNKDLSKNLVTIDQMAKNIAGIYGQTSVKSRITNSSNLENDEVGKQNQSGVVRSGSKKKWKRNSKLTVCVSQEKVPDSRVRSRNLEIKATDSQNLKTESSESVDDVDTSQKQYSERVCKGIEELNQFYLNLHNLNAGSCYVSPSKNTARKVERIPLEKIFTNIRIRNGLQEVEMKNVLTCTQQDTDTYCPLILIQGLSGAGKTSLCYHFVFEWQKRSNAVKHLTDFDLVILIEANKLRSNRLKDFLRDELLPNTTGDMEIDDIIPWLKKQRILFIFDGFYEIESVSFDIIEDVVAKFRDKKIIITTRPEVHKDFVYLARRHCMAYLSVELCGFDVPRLKEFTNKVFCVIQKDATLCKTQTEEFLSYINGRGRVLDKHLKLPLTILLLLLLWKEEPDILNAETTATQLYEELYALYFSILTERTSKYYQGINQVSLILKNLLLYIGEKAWGMIECGTILFSHDIQINIKEVCKEQGLRDREIMSALHVYQIDNEPVICRLPVSFQHNTQMYYLAATYLVDRLQRNILELKDIKVCSGVEHVLMFIMGHLAYQNALTNSLVTDAFQIINMLDIEPTKYEFWWSMLLESRFHSQVAFNIGKEKLPQKHWQLNEANVVRGLKLLAITPLKLYSLLIDIPDKKEPYDIPEFLDSLKEAGCQIKKRQKRIVKVDLHLRHHEVKSLKSSDDFIRALHPWADLQSFTGHLGNQEPGEDIFSSYINLTIINVKISTMNSFHSLSASLRKIKTTVKTLHVIIALPKLSPPELLTVIKISGNLEISVANLEDQHKEWLVEVINKVCGKSGCWRLNLLHSRLTYDTVEWLANELQGVVHDKLNIETND